MIDPERRDYKPMVRLAVIDLAARFLGEEVPINNGGFRYAATVLNTQHLSTLPPERGIELRNFILERKGVKRNARTFTRALKADNYPLAFKTANFLNVYGETDYADQLGGYALYHSFLSHMDLLASINNRFWDRNSYLWQLRSEIEGELAAVPVILRTNDQDRQALAIGYSRAILTEVILDRTLGEDTLTYANPLAIIKPYLS